MKKSSLFLLLAASLRLLNACNSGSSAPPPPPAPTVTITSSPNSVIQGQTVTLTWSSTNATSCTASANPSESDWSGTRNTSGSQSVTPASTGSASYTLMCSGTGGNSSNAASVTVNPPTATHFSVSGPANIPSAISLNFTVTALDALNRAVTTYSGTVHFSSTDPRAQRPPDSTLVSGAEVLSATLTTAGSQTITATDTATSSIKGTSSSINVGALADAFPVEWFGAKGDGVTDDTVAIQNAINAAAAAGGGSVVFKVARYFTTGTFFVPRDVVLCGTVEGPFDVKGVDPAATAIAPTLLVTNTSAPFVTLNGWGSGVTDLLFHYPNQVKSNASTPIVYPYTIDVIVSTPGQPAGGSSNVVRSTVTNAYNFLDICCGRVMAQDLYIGAFNIGVNIDYTADFTTLHNLHNGVFWDEVGNASYPTTIDNWVLNNGTALVVNQMDALEVHDFYAFSRFTGILLTFSPDTTEPGFRTVWGTGSNIDLETVQYGIIATATAGPGYEFSNVVVGAAPGLGQAAVQLRAGGTNPPDVLINGGSVRGTWALGAFPTPAAGNLTVKCVIGSNSPCP